MFISMLHRIENDRPVTALRVEQARPMAYDLWMRLIAQRPQLESQMVREVKRELRHRAPRRDVARLAQLLHLFPYASVVLQIGHASLRDEALLQAVASLSESRGVAADEALLEVKVWRAFLEAPRRSERGLIRLWLRLVLFEAPQIAIEMIKHIAPDASRLLRAELHREAERRPGQSLWWQRALATSTHLDAQAKRGAQRVLVLLLMLPLITGAAWAQAPTWGDWALVAVSIVGVLAAYSGAVSMLATVALAYWVAPTFYWIWKRSTSMVTSRPSSEEGSLGKALVSAWVSRSTSGGWTFRWRIPHTGLRELFQRSAKSLSWLSNTRRSSDASVMTAPLATPRGTSMTSWPASRSQTISSIRTFSSASNRMRSNRVAQQGGVAALEEFSGEVQSGLDVGRRQDGVGPQNLLDRLTGFQQLQNQVGHDPSALETRRPMAYSGVGRYIVSVVRNLKHLFVSLTLQVYADALDAVKPTLSLIATWSRKFNAWIGSGLLPERLRLAALLLGGLAGAGAEPQQAQAQRAVLWAMREHIAAYFNLTAKLWTMQYPRLAPHYVPMLRETRDQLIAATNAIEHSKAARAPSPAARRRWAATQIFFAVGGVLGLLGWPQVAGAEDGMLREVVNTLLPAIGTTGLMVLMGWYLLQADSFWAHHAPRFWSAVKAFLRTLPQRLQLLTWPHPLRKFWTLAGEQFAADNLAGLHFDELFPHLQLRVSAAGRYNADWQAIDRTATDVMGQQYIVRTYRPQDVQPGVLGLPPVGQDQIIAVLNSRVEQRVVVVAPGRGPLARELYQQLAIRQVLSRHTRLGLVIVARLKPGQVGDYNEGRLWGMGPPVTSEAIGGTGWMRLRLNSPPRPGNGGPTPNRTSGGRLARLSPRGGGLPPAAAVVLVAGASWITMGCSLLGPVAWGMTLLTLTGAGIAAWIGIRSRHRPPPIKKKDGSLEAALSSAAPTVTTGLHAAVGEAAGSSRELTPSD
jgi:hypothetical protein